MPYRVLEPVALLLDAPPGERCGIHERGERHWHCVQVDDQPVAVTDEERHRPIHSELRSVVMWRIVLRNLNKLPESLRCCSRNITVVQLTTERSGHLR